MNQFQLYLVIGALVATVISLNVPRAWIWILSGAASFAASTAYSRYGMPYPSAFGIACDSFVVLAIFHFSKLNYELVLWRIFQSMILINILYLAGLIGPKWAYVVALEVMNWAALLVISGTAISKRVDKHEGGTGGVGINYLRGARLALQRERANDPWHKVQR